MALPFRHASDLGPASNSEETHGSSDTYKLSWKTSKATSSVFRKGWKGFDPLIDFIFIHGLGGGSVKTWCKSKDTRLFWPTWLPRDADLQNARIHSFGYNSDWWGSKETALDLHDFGRSLLDEMVTSPVLRKGKQTPILLVGHSMGGLVMKKAYVLARWEDRARDLVGRIQCMFFLATPHRGSDSAKRLNKLLRASAFLHPRQYVADITRNSGAISVINDAFRSFADDLHIWSFYETVKTRIGTSSVLVVERDSAVIGHKNEVVTPVNADHQSICKFDSPANPNYILIRNSLAKAAEDVLGGALGQRAEEMKWRISVLETFLHITHSHEDELNAIESKKTEGSCHWVTSLQTFRHWRDNEDEPRSYHWLTGQPGAGKSVLTTHVVRYLQSLGVDTCFYFFRYGQKAQQTEAGVRFDKDDEKTIWRKLFLNSILQIPISTTQYWVLDGLDECIDTQRLFPLIQKFDSCFPVKMFFSSKRLPDLEKHVVQLQPHMYHHHIHVEETSTDIKMFLEKNANVLPVDPKARQAFIEKLVQMSDGTFLWTELVFEGLRNVFSEEEIDDVLDEVPRGMAPLYNRILESMEQNTRQTRLIRAILEWSVCGTRPLSTTELQAVLYYDLNSKILDVEKTVLGLCGQLLRVNKGMVQVVHATARDFLLGEASDSAFGMDRTTTDEHLALVCLKYLTDGEMRPPRHPTLLSKPVLRSPFVDYACTSFSEHLAASCSASDELFLLMDKFLRGNVLSWVEYILREKQNLYYLTRASKNLRKYLDQRSKHGSPLGEQFSNVDGWQTDLMRIILKFGESLLREPSSVYFILPSLCPTDSRMHKQFGNSTKGLRVVLSADICPRTELLAVAYRGRPPQIWSIRDDVMIASCHMARDRRGVPIMSVSKLLFNPNPAIELLAVAYQDGELAIFESWAGGDRELKSLSADSLTLASTADGRTLASGDAHGVIKIWDFETLTLLYCIQSTEMVVKSLAFSGDGFRLYDIRDTKTKVWEPAVLVRQTVHEESRISDSITPSAPVIGRDREVVDITQIHAPPGAGCVFAGRDDGSVVAYDWCSGALISTLYSHRQNAFVISITWSSSMIATVDVLNKLELHALKKRATGAWAPDGKLFETNLDDRIRELLLHPREPWLLSLFSPTEKRMMTALIGFSMLFSPFTANAYFPAMARLQADLGTSAQLINLTITSYLVLQAVASTLFGDLADASGRRPAFLAMFALYTATNLGLALQRSYPALLTLRMVQSLGASATVAVSYGLVADISTAAERGGIIGVAMIATNLGPALAPLIGGAILSAGSWEWIFWFLVFSVALVLLLLIFLLPETARGIVGNGSVRPRAWRRPLLSVLVPGISIPRHGQRPGTSAGSEEMAIEDKNRRRRIPNPFRSIRVIYYKDSFHILLISGVFYMIYYCLQASIALIFREKYPQYNDIVIGACYLAIGCGVVVGGYLNGRLLNRNYAVTALERGQATVDKNDSDLSKFPIERARLRSMLYLQLLHLGPLVGYGWMMEKDVVSTDH
ncbi:hypothetical protein VTI74DRAFT_3801 [Chaetomium olivicolor]